MRRLAGRQHGRGAPCRVGLARHRDGTPQAVESRGEIEHYDQQRDVAAVGGEHLADQPEMPQQRQRESGEPAEDQPAQQRTAIGGVRIPLFHRLFLSLLGFLFEQCRCCGQRVNVAMAGIGSG